MRMSLKHLRQASGKVGLALAAVGVLTVLCFTFPEELTTPHLRGVYSIALVRALLRIVLVVGLIGSVVDVIVRRTIRCAGALGVALTALAALLGGADIPLRARLSPSPYLGLDWFLVDLIAMTVLFMPFERRSAASPSVGTRRGFAVDFLHFLTGHLLIEWIATLAIFPATRVFAWAALPALSRTVQAQGFLLQLVEVVFVADLTQYGWHRLAHRVPFLWRLHAVHHSAERMDWLAGSRLHILDIVLTRAVILVPLFVLGFAHEALVAYLAFVSIHAVFVHSAIRFPFSAVERFVVTPRYHHFHHAMEAEAIDTNFALHFPILDRLFGTRRLPPGDTWPAAYGIAGSPLPRDYLGLVVYPFVSIWKKR